MPKTRLIPKSRDSHYAVRKAFIIGIGLLIVNLLISLILIQSDFSLTFEGSYQLSPTSHPGFGSLGNLWFIAMSLGWIVALLYPLAAAISAVKMTLHRSSAGYDDKLPDDNLLVHNAFVDCLFDNLQRLQVPLTLLLGWTSGAALAVVFISTLGRAEYGYYPLPLKPLISRGLLSFGASLGTWSLSIFAVVIGTGIRLQHSLWKSLVGVILTLIPVILIMFTVSNDALVGNTVYVKPAFLGIALSAFSIIGPSILTVGFILLRGKSSPSNPKVSQNEERHAN